ncbi:MAG: RsmE family RNA methyltransferase [Planctomycetota bacterium]|nr:RsmE family RNA methyltransferase [Planctomycetota bacterium]
MRLTRVYCPELPDSGVFDIPKDEVQHISRVLRLKVGSSVLAFNGHGLVAQCEIIELDRRRAKAQIKERLPKTENTLPDLTVAVAPAKGKRMPFLIEKLTELGVGRILALETQFGQLSAKQIEKEREAWVRKSIEAAKQCGRYQLPDIPSSTTPEQLCQDLVGLCFVGSPKKSDPSLWTVLSKLKRAQGPFTILIGPEGGFSDSELALFRESDCLDICLGDLILRIETAAIALAGLFRARFDSKNA